ncbi:DUF1496 domain-containing protein [Duganella sp. FT3S]|uniref:DUF1496 domain-containing protein n=1 Tax=Rugamonas fusca TaxID=2758568 RepID=A0A7W2EM91_9BURK|nr:DUF1496 domain-containing protein [Rugamonas fusca]MBA5608514.1 DUF1496 domain-containing protein [Rugamonas fusca]
MIKSLTLSALLLLSMSVGAQTVPLKSQPSAEKPKREYAPTSYCIYDDKKYSEGAVKAVDGQVLICMVRDGISVSFEEGVQAPRDLVWELGSSFRGKSRLKASSDVTK